MLVDVRQLPQKEGMSRKVARPLKKSHLIMSRSYATTLDKVSGYFEVKLIGKY
jgi:hypothetical protein